MRLTPAHTVEAEGMAIRLLDEFVCSGMIDNLRPSVLGSSVLQLEEIKAILSVSMGWSSWSELTLFVKEAHEPIYADERAELFDKAVEIMSRQLGFDYCCR